MYMQLGENKLGIIAEETHGHMLVSYSNLNDNNALKLTIMLCIKTFPCSASLLWDSQFYIKDQYHYQDHYMFTNVSSPKITTKLKCNNEVLHSNTFPYRIDKMHIHSAGCNSNICKNLLFTTVA